MNETLQTFPGSADAGTLAAERNRVLRNTYWLLALSMVPTVLGAWVGVQSGFMRAMSPGISMIVFLVGAFGLMFAFNLTPVVGFQTALDYYQSSQVYKSSTSNRKVKITYVNIPVMLSLNTGKKQKVKGAPHVPYFYLLPSSFYLAK